MKDSSFEVKNLYQVQINSDENVTDVLNLEKSQIGVQPIVRGGILSEGMFAEVEPGSLRSLDGQSNKSIRNIKIPAGGSARRKFLAEWSERARHASKKGGAFSILLLPLAACGGGGTSSNPGEVSEGYVIDGYVTNAFVFRDEDGDGIYDAADGEATAYTDSAGKYSLGGSSTASIVMDPSQDPEGRTAIDLDNPNEAFTGILKAPAGSTVVTPLTTLVQQIVETGATAEVAEAAVKTALGITGDVELTTLDPIAADNVEVYKAGVQVAALISESGGGEAGLAVSAALAKMVQNSSGAVDLTDVDVVKAVIDTAIADSPTATASLDSDSVASSAASQAAVIAAATSIDDVSNAQSATFTVTETNNVIVFGGDATGTVVMTLNSEGGATFTRGGASGKDGTGSDASVVTIDSVADKTISGAVELTVVVSAEATSGADEFIINAPDATKIDLRGSMGEGADSIVIKVADDTAGTVDSRDLILDTSGLTVASNDRLVFDFDGEEDLVNLTLGSDVSQFSEIEVAKGTLDVRSITIKDGLQLTVNSGVSMSLDQFHSLESLVSASGLGALTITLDSSEALSDLTGSGLDSDFVMIGTSITVKNSAGTTLLSNVTGSEVGSVPSGLTIYPGIPELAIMASALETQISSNDTDIASNLSDIVDLSTLIGVITDNTDDASSGASTVAVELNAIQDQLAVISGQVADIIAAQRDNLTEVTITDNASSTTNGDVTYTFTFDEAVTGFTAADVTVVNGAKGTFTANSTTEYTLVVTPNDNYEGDVLVSVKDSVAVDGNSNGNAAALDSVQAVDTLDPTVTITSSASSLKVGETSTLTITFSEAVTAFTKDDISVESGTLGTLSSVTTNSDGTATYTIAYTPATTTDSEVAISVSTSYTDTVGNAGRASSTLNLNVDTVAPAVAITGGAVSSKDAVHAISGTGEAGATVSIVDTTADPDVVLSTTVVNVDGAWTTTIDLGTDGTHALKAVAVDAIGNTTSTATVDYTLVEDDVPAVTITDNASSTTNGDVTYTFTFDEAVTGFTAADVTVVNGAKGTFTANSTTEYTLVVTPNDNYEGDVLVSVKDSVAVDGNSNGNAAALDSVQAVDTLDPTVTITSSASSLKVGETSTLTITFSEAVTAFTKDDISVESGTLGTLSSVTTNSDGTATYTIAYTPATTTDSEVAISVSTSYTDTVGNAGRASSTLNLNVDTVAPAVAITGGAVSSKDAVHAISGTGEAGATVSIVDTTADPDVVLSTTVVNVDGAWTTTIDLGTDGTHALKAVAVDAIGNTTSTATVDYTLVEDDVPAVTITDNASSTTNGDVTYTFTFDEAVTGFTAADVTVVNGAKGTFTANSTTEYTLVVTPNDNYEGDVLVSVKDSVAVDGNSNGNAAALDSVQAVDTLDPTVTITSSASSLKVGETSTLTITFSEAVTAFTKDDISVESGTLGTLSSVTTNSDGTATYTIAYTPATTTDSEVAISVSTSYTDTVGNAGRASSTLNLNVDTVAPAVAITGGAVSSKDAVHAISGTGEAGATVSIVDTTADPDVVLSTTVVNVDGAWTTTIDLGTDGTHALKAVAVDAIGNTTSTATVDYTLVEDDVPAVTITDNASSTTNGDVTYTFTFDEAVTGFTAADVTVVNGAKGTFTANSTTEYTLVVTPNDNYEGDVLVSVKDNVAVDGNSNGNAAALDSVQAVDTLDPTVTITSSASSLKVGETSTLTITFSEAVTAFTKDDISVESGTLGTLSSVTTNSDGTATYTIAYTPATTTDSEVAISVSTSYTDTVGNAGRASSTLNLNVDTVAPAVAITGGAVSSKDAVHAINGTGEAGATVSIVDTTADPDVVLSTTVVNVDGAWTTTIDLGTDGTHALKAVAVDAIGNTTSTATVDYTLVEDDVPVLNSASVSGTTLTLTYSEALDDSVGEVPVTGDFSVSTDGVANAVNAVAVAGSTVTLTLGTAVEFGQTVLVSYTDPTGDSSATTQDAAGNDAVSFVNQTVTNSTARANLADTPSNLVAEGVTSLDAAGNITTNTTAATIQQARTLMDAQNTGTTTIHELSVSAADAVSLAPDSNDTLTLVSVSGVFGTGKDAEISLTNLDYASNITFAGRSSNETIYLPERTTTDGTTGGVLNLDGGAGNDTFLIYGGASGSRVLSSSDVLKGGAGTSDTLHLVGTVDVSGIATFSGIENLTLENATSLVTMTGDQFATLTGTVTGDTTSKIVIDADADNAVDISGTGLTFSNVAELEVAENIALTVNLTQLGTITAIDTTATGATLAVGLNGVTIDGTSVDVSDADLGGATINVTLANSATFTINAEQAHTATVGGTGSVVVKGTQGSNLDISALTSTSTDITDVNSGSAISNFTPPTVGDSKTLTLTAAQATGKTISGAGTVQVKVTDTDTIAFSADTDLSDITATLGLATTLTVAENKTLTMTAAQATGKTISGAGTVSIQDTVAATTDLSLITASLAFTGGSITVAENQTLTLTAAQATAKTISGAGTVQVKVTDTDTIAFSADTDLSGISATLGLATTLTVAENQTLTMTAAQLTGKTISGAGTVQVKVTSTDTIAFSADTDLSDITATLGLATTLTVAENKTLTMTAAQATGKTISGAGTVSIQDTVAATTDLSLITASLAFTGGSITVAENQTLTLTAAQATAKTISGAGTVQVKVTSTDTIAFSASTDLSGISATLGLATTLTVAENQTLTMTAAQLTGKTISGAGTVQVKVTDTDTIAFSADTDLSDITATLGLATTLTVAENKTLTMTAAQATGKIIGGDGTVSIQDTVAATTDLSLITASLAFTGGSITVAENQTLTLTAAQATAKTISGAGTVQVKVTDTDTIAFSADTDLSDITATLGLATTLTVAENKTLTMTAAQATGKTISGAGTVSIQDTVAATTDLSLITASLAFTGGSITVAENQTLTLTAAQATAKTISGAGTVQVKVTDTDTIAFSASTDLSGISATLGLATTLTVAENQTLTMTAAQLTGKTISGAGTVQVKVTDTDTIAFSADTDLSGISATLGLATTLTVAENQTLTMTAAQLTGKTISGAGTVQVKVTDTDTIAFSADTDLSDITATLGLATTLTVAENKTLTMTAAQATGKIIGGDGTVSIQDTVAATTDLSLITASLAFTGGSITVAENQTLTLTAAQATAKTISGAGTVQVKVTSTDTIAFSASTDLSGISATLGLATTLTVAENKTLTMTAAQATGKTISGAGTVQVKVTDTDTIAFSADTDLSDITATLGLATTLTVAENKTLTMTAAQATGKTISGAGTVSIQDTVAATTDLSLITASLAFTGGSITVAENQTLTLTAAQATAKTISGAGTVQVKVTDTDTIAFSASTDLSGISATLGLATTLTVAENQTLTMTAAQLTGKTISGAGTVQVKVTSTDTIAFSADTDLSGISATLGLATTLTVAENKTLTMTAAQLTGKTISGAGTVQVKVTDTDTIAFSADTDLSDITATLGLATTLTVAENKTLTMTAAQATGKIIGGDGTVSIQDTVAATTDLSLITASLAFTGGSITVAENQTLTLTAAQATAKTISGAGTVQVKVTSTDTIAFSASTDLSGISATLGLATTLTVAENQTLTMTAAQLTGKTISGAGTVQVKVTDTDTIAFSADTDLSDITATLGLATTLTVAENKTLTMTAAQATGKTISGAGTVSIQDTVAATTDLSLITASLAFTGGSITVAENQTLTLTAAQATAKTISGAGTVQVKVTDTDTIAFSASTDLSGISATLGLATTLTVAENQTLTMTAAQLTGKTISGAGTVQVKVTDTDTIAFSADTDLSGISATLGLATTLTVAENQTLTMTAAQLTGKTISGAGTVQVKVTDTDTIAFSADTDLSDITATLGLATTLTVAENKTLTMTAAQATGKTISGAGTVSIQDTVAATTDLSLITASLAFTGGSITVAENQTLTLTAAQATAKTISGAGTVQVKVTDTDTIAFSASTDLSGISATLGLATTLTVAENQTLTMTAAQLTGKTISGAGTVQVKVTDTDTIAFSADTDLSDITATLGLATTLTVAENKTLTMTAAQATGKIIGGDGTVSIQDTVAATTDLSLITASLAFTGGSITVAENQTLTLTAAQATAKTISGAGTVQVKVTDTDTIAFSASTDLSGISATLGLATTLTVAENQTLTMTAAQLTGKTISGAGTVQVKVTSTDTIAFSASTDLSGISATLGLATTLTVAENKTLTMTAAQATGKTISGAGTVQVKVTDTDTIAFSADTDLSDITATLGLATTLTVAENKTLTMTAAQATGKTISGAGTVSIQDTVAATTDLSLITASLAFTGGSITVAENQTLTLTAAQATAKTISGAGTVQVKVTDTDTIAFSASTDLSGISATLGLATTLTVAENQTLTMTAAQLTGKTISGAGTVQVKVTSTDTIAFSASTDLSGISATLGLATTLTVAENKTLTMTAAQATGKTISGAGTVQVKVTDTDTIAFSADTDLSDITATLGLATTLTVAENKTLTMTAAQATGKTISGAGTVSIQDTVAATTDLSLITASLAFTGGSITVAENQTLTLTAAQATAKTISGAGTVQVKVTDTDTIAFSASTDLSGISATLGLATTLTVAENQTLTMTAAQLTGKTISGAGTVQVKVTDTDTIAFSADTDLSDITATLGLATTLTVAENKTLTMTAAQATGKIIGGDGTVSIQDTVAATTDLSLITASLAFTGGSITVAENQTLTLTAAQATAKTISGAGTVQVKVTDTDTIAFSASTDLSGISATLGLATTLTVAENQTLTMTAAQLTGKTISGAGTVQVKVTSTDTIAFSASTDLSGISATLGLATTLTVAENKTLTMTAAQATGKTISGAGTVQVKVTDTDTIAFSADTDLSDITATLGLATTLTVAENKTLTMTAAQATGKTISGAGTVSIQDTVAATTDLSLITASLAFTGGSITVAENQTLTLTAAQATAKTISGAGTVQVKVTDTDTIAFSASTDLSGISATLGLATTLTVAENQTLTMTAAQLTGKTISGAGTVQVKVTSTDTIAFSASTDLSGISATLGLATTLTVAENQTLTITAAQATGKTISGAGTTDVSGAVTADANFTDISSSIKFGGDNSVTVSNGATLTVTGDQADQIAGGVTKLTGGNLAVKVETAALDLTQKDLTDVDSLTSTSGKSAVLTVSQATTLGTSNISGTYLLKDTVTALSNADATIFANAGSYSVLDTSTNIGNELGTNGIGDGTILFSATAIDTSDNETVDLTVAQIASKGSIFTDGYDLLDTSTNLLNASQSVIDAVVNASNDVKVAAGDANELTVAQYNTLIGRTTVDTWSYEIQDSASSIIAASGTNAITQTSTVSVTSDAAGSLAVSEYTTLKGLTKPDGNDDWSYSIDDTPTNIDTEVESNGDAGGSMLGGASSVTVSGTGASEALDLQSATIGTLNYVINMGAGADSVKTGSGNDTVDLGSNDGAVDTYVFAASDTANGEDVVSNFEGGRDKIDVSAFSSTKVEISGTPDITTTNGTVYFVTTSTAGAADAGQSVGAAFVINLSANWSDNNATSWIVLTDNNSSVVYEFNDTAASADGLQASELTLLATMDGLVGFEEILISS